MKYILIPFCILAVSISGLRAQTLGQDQIRQLKESFVKTPATTAIQNAVTANKDLKSLVQNRERAGKVDHYFKYRCNIKGITNQYSSGRCWMFTSMNVLRPAVMEQFNLSQYDFSHNFCYFWDMLEKANLFLENVIATADRDYLDQEVAFYFQSPVGDGGVWNLFWNIAEKYGVVPAEVMPETEHSNNTSQMRALISEVLRGGGYRLRALHEKRQGNASMQAEKMATLQEVYRILSLCLGTPPSAFIWRYKDRNGEIQSLETTPLDFYRSIVKEDYHPDHYIMIMNDPTREFYKVYEISNYRNTYEGVNWRYLNLPAEVIKQAALASIKDKNPLYVSCDVSKQLNRAEGIMDMANYDYAGLFGVKLDMDKKARILTRQSGSSHAMNLVGCDTDAQDKPVKWEFENSWGSASGHNGFLTFTDDWFSEYLFRIVIPLQYLDAKSKEALRQKPVMLPPYDYMW